MFTGIIEAIGTVKSLGKKGNIWNLEISLPKIADGVEIGQSICVNGVCLTVTEVKRSAFSSEVMPETIRCTNFARLKTQDKVNLERALAADGRLDGHFVTGHIDSTGTICKRQFKSGDVVLTLRAQQPLLRQIVLKGSVALDGVSLTVSALADSSFCVNLIPYTLKNTTLHSKRPGDTINIECDLLGKYIDKFLSQNKQTKSSIAPSLLKEHGF